MYFHGVGHNDLGRDARVTPTNVGVKDHLVSFEVIDIFEESFRNVG